MRQPITFAVVFFFAATIAAQPLNNSKANRTRGKLPEGSEAANALARLGELTRPALREKLKHMQQPNYRPSPLLVSKIIEAQHLPIADGKAVDRLKAALQPVLDYHERSKMPIYVLFSEQPKIYMVARAVIIITTRLMLSANYEEIRALVAHELGHEYVWDECAKAMKANDEKLMRECELFCDAVAAFSLKEIGDDPASLGRILGRLSLIGIKPGSIDRHKTPTHPSVDVRKKLNKFLCQQLN